MFHVYLGIYLIIMSVFSFISVTTGWVFNDPIAKTLRVIKLFGSLLAIFLFGWYLVI